MTIRKNKPKLLKTKATLREYGGHNINVAGNCNTISSVPKKNLRILHYQHKIYQTFAWNLNMSRFKRH